MEAAGSDFSEPAIPSTAAPLPPQFENFPLETTPPPMMPSPAPSFPSPLESFPTPSSKPKPPKNSSVKTGDTSPFRDGQMDYLMSSEMKLNVATKCTVRIAGKEVKKADIKIGKGSEHQNIKVTDEMSVRLIDVSGGEHFKIVSLNTEKQSIDEGMFSEWNFMVTPLKTNTENKGTYVLMLSLTAHYDGKKKDYPLIEKSILVTDGKVDEKNTKRIVFLAADTRVDLNVDKEAKIIRDELKKGKRKYQYTKVLNLSAIKLIDVLVNENPSILHYSGHSAVEGIFMFDDKQQPVLADVKSIQKIFEANKSKLKIECLILNSCYSKTQADALKNYTKYIIGTTNAVPDDDALLFSQGFYKGVFNELDYKNAFDGSLAALELNDDEETAEIYHFG